METRPVIEGARPAAAGARGPRPAFRKLAKGWDAIRNLQALLATIALASAIETGRSVWCVADPTFGNRAILDALLHGGFTALLLVGAMRLPVRPWIWTGGLALTWVGWAVVRSAFGLEPEAEGYELWLGFALGAVFVRSLGLRALVERHPDSISARRLAALGGGSVRSGAGTSVRASASLRNQERLERRARATLVGFSVAIVLGIAGVAVFLRPESTECLLERFQRSWNQDGPEAIAAFGSSPSPAWLGADREELAQGGWPELGALDSSWTSEGNGLPWRNDPRNPTGGSAPSSRSATAREACGQTSW